MGAKELASLMGVSESDCVAFLDCLRVWTDKGYSVEQAIERHMQQMRRLVNAASDVAKHPEIRTAAANAVWDAVNV
ncbi:hypothetical protein [Chromobacterium haemolyticum]|uniref:Uncharacterized protein n=1 Tax=Chromobacterium haemolyticum TaxID=394935 RepID=A0A1W0D5N4_9NEIS|nr:hypothetical protein [Chromobacterium haemolyticum]OQS42304.1 hypothetical protein B0T45_05795 [Chromobacterium haemolyticum]